jgi:broad specificity phosphatase PhoE
MVHDGAASVRATLRSRAVRDAVERRVILVRHGRPAVDWRALPGHRFAEWMAAYDEAGVDPRHPPPPRLRALAAAADVRVTSTLRRARESLALLDCGEPAVTDTMLCEAPLPGPFRTSLRLHPLTWQFVSRMAWLAGWSPNTESFAATRVRAGQAARLLRDLSRSHGSVLCVGHGFLHTMVGVALRRAGWRAPVPIGRGYWSAVVYRTRSPA